MSNRVLTFTVFMISLVIVVLISYVIPMALAISLVPLILGSWLVMLGIRERPEPERMTLTSSAFYTVWGGLLVTVTASYLAFVFSYGDLRLAISVFLIGIILTVIGSYRLERIKRVSKS